MPGLRHQADGTRQQWARRVLPQRALQLMTVIDAQARFTIARAAAQAKREYVEVDIDGETLGQRPDYSWVEAQRPDGIRTLGELIAAGGIDMDGRVIEP